ncbi:MAG: ABC transporter ATP-binding protein [Acidobacteriota bacterium]|jgi:molybdopterin-binding protein
MLAIEDLSFRIGGFQLKNIRFSVERGDYFVILGASGVGKTLLLETIAGLRPPESGKIHLRGRDITLERIQKRNLSIVYQDGGLFPHLSVHDNIAYPLKSRGSKELDGKVNRAASQTGIADKLNRRPESLSGGEYQRATLARCLAADSDMFLLDEPLSSLDAKSKIELRALLRKLNREGITMVHVTHDYEEAVSLATKIGIMENGALVHVASPEEIFRHPKSEFIASFVGIKNYFRGTVRAVTGSDLKEFCSNGIKIYCLTEIPEGEVFLMIGPGEITVSNEAEAGSARNRFKGVIRDMIPARLGMDLIVDVGVEVVATISSDARNSLDLEIGKEIWISFKASSCRIYA